MPSGAVSVRALAVSASAENALAVGASAVRNVAANALAVGATYVVLCMRLLRVLLTSFIVQDIGTLSVCGRGYDFLK